MPNSDVSDVINFYDLLQRMVDRIPWRDENDMKSARELLAKVREVNLFGYLADNTTVTDPRKPAPERRMW